ncbi:MAG: GIY-YIG nuclease family protein [Nitrospirae bacterium]|nr:GIY-YIG nuclease family protein [Nitrospirota bacterium]
MHYVYVLHSLHREWAYIGYTSDLPRRMKPHRDGKVPSTRAYLPVQLIYYEAYLSSEDARQREKGLKYFGRAYAQLKRRMDGSLRLLQARIGAG